MQEQRKVPRAFFWRRMHSFMGLWLVLFLIEHLFTNSQAALWFGNDSSRFVSSVNALQNLPFLHLIEIGLLGVPFLIHIVWGIKYLWTGDSHSVPGDGTKPSFPVYPENHAYSWQRITSWILVFGVVLHVVQMRFVDYPRLEISGEQKYYVVKVSDDPGLRVLASKWKVLLHEDFVNPGKLKAETLSFGIAELLSVRDTFKMPLMAILYTLFVFAATFHGFNGLWTFCITWGLTLTEKSQKLMRKITTVMMGIITFLGLSAIWGTYLWT